MVREMGILQESGSLRLVQVRALWRIVGALGAGGGTCEYLALRLCNLTLVLFLY